MRPTDGCTLVLRPRRPWEALDLGVLLAARHWKVLMGSWALATVPVYVLASVLFWRQPAVAAALIWWLKPAFERLPLYILSQATFGPAPGVRQALREWRRLLRPQLLASLTWRRLSLSRSFTLPVQQLEGLGGRARVQRLAQLRRRNAGAARWLTLAGVHLEMALMLGAMALLYLLTPHEPGASWTTQWLAVERSGALWAEHLNNALYMVILLLWEPVYVACGFCLYLNRRTVLEGWDIEQQFRRLRGRLLAGAGVALVLLLTVLPANDPAWADPVPPLLAPLSTTPSPLAPANIATGPQSPRLQHQALTSQASRQAAQAIVQQPPFSNPQTVTRWRWLGADSAGLSESTASARPWLPGAVEVVLSVAALALILVVLWRRRAWLETLVGRLPGRAPHAQADAATTQVPVQVPAALPDDLPAAVEHLWPQAPREALSLLYRGLLGRLQNDHQLALRPADTEDQVIARVAALGDSRLEDFTRRVTRHWQALAYGHQPLSVEEQRQLVSDWRTLFEPGASS